MVKGNFHSFSALSVHISDDGFFRLFLMFQIIIFLLTLPQILGRIGYTKETLGPGKTVVEGWYVQNFKILVRVLNYEIKNLGFLGKINFIYSLI